VNKPINAQNNVTTTDAAVKRYSRARIVSNVGFIFSSLFVFVSLWYIGAKGTPLDPFIIFSSLIGVKDQKKESTLPQNIKGLELETINGKVIPAIFMENDTSNPVNTVKKPDKVKEPKRNSKEYVLKQSLKNANHLFRSWRHEEAEKAYKEIIKQLPELRALKLQRDVSNMFFNQGMKFYKERRYKKALDVFRIALHFDAKNKLAHKFTAQTYRRLNLGSKAKYHEKMANKL